MIKKIINFLGMASIIITIITFNLLIGGNEKALQILPICILMGINIAILLTKKIIQKDNIVIKSKVDIAVLFFMISLCLPLIFNTYSTYQGTIEFIIKYFFVYSFYLLIRNIVNTDKKSNIIITTTIISSLIIIVLGLDLMHGNIFSGMIRYLDLGYTADRSFSSTFGYANTVAIYMVFCIFLAINRIENSQSNKKRIFYALYILLALYILDLTLSRFVALLLMASILVFLLIKYYNKIKQNKKALIIILLCTAIILIGFIIYVNIASKYSKEGDLTKARRITTEFNSNEENIMYLDLEFIDAETTSDKKTMIQLVEINKYSKETVLASEEIEDVVQNNIIKFIPTESIYYLELRVINRNDKQITIKKCYINDKEYVFESKYMPKFIYSIVQTLSFKDKSIVDRMHFYKTCLNMSKGHLILGQGGNTWKKLCHVYQEFPFYVKEAHSYFFELLISYGIIGVCSFFAIIILLLITTIKVILKDKEKRKKKLSILIGLVAMLLHTLSFDFNMSFIVIILTVFGYIAILQFDNNDEIEINKYVKNTVDYGVILCFLIIFIVLVKTNIARYLLDDKKGKAEMSSYVAIYQLNYFKQERDEIDLLPKIKRFIEREPYDSQNDIYKRYWNIIFENIDKLSNEEIQEYIQFGVNTFTKIENENKMSFNMIMRRAEIMTDVALKLEQINMHTYSNKLKEQIIKEYKENKVILTDFERNNITKERSDEYIKTYKGYLQKISIH